MDVCLTTGGCPCQVEVWKINMAYQWTLEIYFKPVVDHSGVSGWDTKANQCHFFKCLFFKIHAYSNFASIIQKNFFPPLSHLKITCRRDTLIFKYYSVHFLHTGTLHNYNPTIKFKTLILAHYYPLILRSHSSFSSCLHNVFDNERI